VEGVTEKRDWLIERGVEMLQPPGVVSDDLRDLVDRVLLRAGEEGW
jgi:hypothetical protein